MPMFCKLTVGLMFRFVREMYCFLIGTLTLCLPKREYLISVVIECFAVIYVVLDADIDVSVSISG